MPAISRSRWSASTAGASAVNTFALHDVSDQAAVRRWGASAFAIAAAHAALIALALNWYTQRPVPGVSLPAIMVDMAPASSAPQPPQEDPAPGPVMTQAHASPPKEKPRGGPPVEKRGKKNPAREPPKPVPEAKPTPLKPKVVRADAK